MQREPVRVKLERFDLELEALRVSHGVIEVNGSAILVPRPFFIRGHEALSQLGVLGREAVDAVAKLLDALVPAPQRRLALGDVAEKALSPTLVAVARHPALPLAHHVVQPAVLAHPPPRLHGVGSDGGHVHDLLVLVARKRLAQLARPPGHGAVLHALVSEDVALHVGDHGEDPHARDSPALLALDLVGDVAECFVQVVAKRESSKFAHDFAQALDSGHASTPLLAPASAAVWGRLAIPLEHPVSSVVALEPVLAESHCHV